MNGLNNWHKTQMADITVPLETVRFSATHVCIIHYAFINSTVVVISKPMKGQGKMHSIDNISFDFSWNLRKPK